MSTDDTVWKRGRFDARRRAKKVLFGRMYEDVSIELSVFRPRSRVFCVASAGCTAMKLAPLHEVVAVDINPVQLAYAARRFAGARPERGTAERMMDIGRALVPLLDWTRSRVRTFLELDDPRRQMSFWRAHLDTRRFRVAFDTLLSAIALRAVYASPFLDFLPRRMGAVLRSRMERCFSRHPNRTNPYIRALLLGELPHEAVPPEASRIQLVDADAADCLERAPRGSFDAFTLSNILDGAGAAYRHRLLSAVKRAAAPEAVVVLRSFGEPDDSSSWNRAADDRSMLWGVVEVRPVATLAIASGA